MQFRTLSIASAVAAFAVLAQTSQAAECTKDQLEALEKLQDEDVMDKMCPDTDDDSGSFDFEKIDPKAWAKVSPCANTTCVSYLKTQVAKVPNCEIEKFNVQTHYNDKLTLCIDIASGKLTAAEIEKRIGNFTDGSDDWFGSGSDDWLGSGSEDWSESGSDDDDDNELVAMALANKNATTNSTANSTTPAPTTKKSGATMTALTGGVALVVAAVASAIVA